MEKMTDKPYYASEERSEEVCDEEFLSQNTGIDIKDGPKYTNPLEGVHGIVDALRSPCGMAYAVYLPLVEDIREGARRPKPVWHTRQLDRREA